MFGPITRALTNVATAIGRVVGGKAVPKVVTEGVEAAPVASKGIWNSITSWAGAHKPLVVLGGVGAYLAMSNKGPPAAAGAPAAAPQAGAPGAPGAPVSTTPGLDAQGRIIMEDGSVGPQFGLTPQMNAQAAADGAAIYSANSFNFSGGGGIQG